MLEIPEETLSLKSIGFVVEQRQKLTTMPPSSDFDTTTVDGFLASATANSIVISLA